MVATAAGSLPLAAAAADCTSPAAAAAAASLRSHSQQPLPLQGLFLRRGMLSMMYTDAISCIAPQPPLTVSGWAALGSCRLSLGGFQEAATATHRYNTHVLIDDVGTIRASYRKIHLFDLDIPGKVTLKESNATLPGEASAVPPP